MVLRPKKEVVGSLVKVDLTADVALGKFEVYIKTLVSSLEFSDCSPKFYSHGI